jgi:hypothetical protein
MYLLFNIFHPKIVILFATLTLQEMVLCHALAHKEEHPMPKCQLYSYMVSI